MVSGSGSLRTSTALGARGLALGSTARRWRPGVDGEDLEIDGATDAGPRHLPEARRRGRRQLLTAVAHAQPGISFGEDLTIELAQRQAPPIEPPFGFLVALVLGRPLDGRQRGHQVGAERRRCARRGRGHDQRDEAGEGFDGGSAGAGLPLAPLRRQPASRPGVDGEVVARHARDGPTGLGVEGHALVLRLEQHRPEAFGFGLGAEGSRVLAAVDRPSHDPRSLRLRVRTPVLHVEDPDVLEEG